MGAPFSIWLLSAEAGSHCFGVLESGVIVEEALSLSCVVGRVKAVMHQETPP